MEQTPARERAKELGGLAVSARRKDGGEGWHLGGWPLPGDEWIVVSLDRTQVLDDRTTEDFTFFGEGGGLDA